jgi:hypothetical protein
MRKTSQPEPEFMLTSEENPDAKPQLGLWKALDELLSSQPAPPVWRLDKPNFASLDLYLEQALPQLFAYLDERPREADGTWRIGLPLDRARDLERKALPDLVSQLRSYAANGERKALYSAVLTLLAFLVREQLRNGELPVYMPLSGGGERTRADRIVDLQ